MKKSLIIAFTAFIAFASFGQTKLKDIKNQVGNPEIIRNWEVGETKEVYKASITRKMGENHFDSRTNVLFYPASRSGIASSSGEIALFFDRTSKDLADAGLFRVYITDETDTEIIYDESLASETPDFYKWDIYYNYKKIKVKEDLGSAFNIYVDDNGSGKTYKFFVEQEVAEKQVEPIITQNK